MTVYRLETLCKLLDVPCPRSACFTHIAFDSREVTPQSIFFALPGEKSDGAEFIHEAIARGAIACVAPHNAPHTPHTIHVASPLHALHQFANHRLTQVNPQVLAITGSLGKTTTKEFIRQLLEPHLPTQYTRKNFNSKVSLPTQILHHLEDHTKVFVVEMGLTHAGDLKRLTQTAPPTLAVLTTIDAVHFVNFTHLDQILDAKLEIFSHPHTNIGLAPQRLLNHLPQRIQRIAFTQTHLQKSLRQAFPYHSSGMLYNFQAAVTVCEQLGMCQDQMVETARSLHMPENRLEWVEKEHTLVLNDSYNACKTSMFHAFEVFTMRAKGVSCAVLGSMKELGTLSASHHETVLKKAVETFTHVICIGPEWQCLKSPISPRTTFVDTLEQAHACTQTLSPSPQAYLIKGSNSLALWQLKEVL